MNRRTLLGATGGLLSVSAGCLSRFDTSKNTEDPYSSFRVTNRTTNPVAVTVTITLKGEGTSVFDERLSLDPNETKAFDEILEGETTYEYSAVTESGIRAMDSFDTCGRGDDGCWLNIAIFESHIDISLQAY